MPRRMQLTCCLFLAVLSGLLLVPAARAQLMPDYRLGVGSALIFEIRKEHLIGKDLQIHTGTNTIWVIGQQPDGNWLAVLGGTLTTTDGTGTVLKTTEELNFFEMTARGRILDSEEPVTSETFRECFVALPEVATNVFSSWNVEWPERGDTQRYEFHSASDPAQGKWIWTRTDGGLQRELHGVTRTATALFNAQAGLMERMEIRFEIKGEGGRILGAMIAQLRRSDILLNFELKKLINQSAEFKALRSTYLDTVGEIVSSPLNPADLLNDAAGDLLEATNTLTYPVVAGALQRERDGHDANRDRILAEANYWRPRLGNASQPWETETLNGKPVSSAVLKDNVTVLHFWQADSVVSIRGLRKLDIFAKRFEGKPVTFMSATLDGDIQNARTVATAAQVQHSVVKGGPLLQHYPVRGFPTLLVFDAGGVLRDVRYGEHAYRLESLNSKIERLLQE